MRFKLLNIFSIFHFGLLLVFLLVFLYLQYNTQTEFQQNILKNLFQQNSAATHAILTRENQELNDLINTLEETNNINQINDIHVDCIFISKNGKLIQLQGFNISIDLHQLSNKLISSHFDNSLIKRVVFNETPYYLLIHNKPLVDKTTGKVLGKVWGVKIFNENQLFINSLKKDLDIANLIFLDKQNNIISTSLNKKEQENFNIEIDIESIHLSYDEKYIYTKKSIESNFEVIYIINSNQYAHILNYFISNSFVSIFLFLVVGFLGFLFIKKLFISKLLEIKDFIKDKLENKDAQYKNSNIVELDNIANDFNTLFKEHLDEKEKFQQFLAHSSDAIFIMDVEGKLLEYSDETQRLLGYTKEEMQILTLYDWEVNFSKEEAKRILQDHPLNEIQRFESIHRRKNGTTYNASITAIKLKLQNNEIIYASARNITKEKKKERLLQEKISIVDQNVLTSSTDIDGIITEASLAFSKLSGYSKEELIGANHNIIKHPDTPRFVFDELWDTIQKDGIWKGEIKNRKKCGEHYWIKTAIMPLFDENHKKIGYTSIRQDITDKKHIEEISRTDPLTGIFNRRYFDELFFKIVNSARRDSKVFSFLIMDIDHFKQYNDTYGHQKGDIVLKKVASAIKSSLHRADDYCFRLGGEEFGVIFKSDSPEHCEEFANTIRQNIENLQIIHEKNSASEFVTTSLGLISIYPNENTTIDEVYKLADELLYSAKENGRNQVKCNI